MKTLTLTALMIVLLGFAGIVGAAPKDEPGYIDLNWIEIPANADEIQDIDLGHVLKSVAQDAEKNGDTELAKALGMVRSVRMKSFSVDHESAAMVKKAADRIKTQLEKEDWNRLAYMKDKTEEVSINTKYDKDGNLVGLMVVVIDLEDTATFANVQGDLDLATLMHLIGSLEEGTLDEYLEEFEGVDGIHIE